ncbi:MAG: VanW family protein [Armatimonadota bacterium]
MRRSKSIKIISSIAVGGIVVFKLATAPLCEPYQPGINSLNISPLPNYRDIIPISMKTDFNNLTRSSNLLTQALTAQTSRLIWTGEIDLTHQDDATISNVLEASNAIDLTAINPGDTFSFNDIVGMRTEDKGYKPGLMFTNGEVITGIGGGICIVSTLLYDAVLQTGLKIIERHPHSGPVSYADPGRDAAVSYGWADLKFKNNTKHPVYIKTSVNNYKLIVSVFGASNPGRTIEIVSRDFEELPYKIVEIEDAAVPEGEVVVDQKARTGYVVTTVRIFRQNGKIEKEEILSRDVILPKDKIVRLPLMGPMILPAGIMPLPGFPDMPFTPGTQTVPETPVHAEAPKVSSPKSGVIHIPDEPKPAEPHIDQPESEPAPDPVPVPLPDPSPVPVTAPASVLPADSDSGRSLSTIDRTTPTASE